jgi:SAM-dependent methyltransferase
VTDPDAALAAQYEAYPYPARHPRDEATRLLTGSPSHLREIDHWVFGARRSRSRPLHALFAGGGTGDGTIMLAQHLASAGRPGHVTWLDRSDAARRIVQARAQARGLAVTTIQASLLDLPGPAPGPFDYIDCCGVLHHLPDPAAGLAALVRVLAPEGGIGLMVYAPHGRTGVYMVQDALRRLAPIDTPPAERLDTARRVMRNLPQPHWLRANRNFSDHLDGGEAGLYDLLLNPRDRPFPIAGLLALVAGAGLRPAALIEPIRYDPAVLLPDARLRARLAALDAASRAAIAEDLAGNLSTHILYCVRAENPVAPLDPLDPHAIPIARERPLAELAAEIRNGILPYTFDGLTYPVPLPPLAAAILRAIDGTRTVSQLRETIGAGFDRDWPATYAGVNALNRLLIAAPA